MSGEPPMIETMAAVSSFQDPAAGFEERFLTLSLELGATVGVLSTPLGPAQPLAWVQCHSFGAEQAALSVLEAMLSRRLGASGFPTLRFHGQGYGDSERLDVQPGLGTHLSDVEQAVSTMQRI